MPDHRIHVWLDDADVEAVDSDGGMHETPVLVRVGGDEWVRPDVLTYDSEAHLQALIAQHPEWIPGVGPDSLTVEELATRGGPVDVCVIGRDGTITVVECKLAANTERRRMVVGQVIDYASAIWTDTPDGFVDAWRRRSGRDLVDLLDAEAFEALNRNITDARIDLCLAVDRIDEDLRRLVEYLNHVTRDEMRVTALQLGYAKQDDFEVIMPTTFGGEIARAKERRTERGGGNWTRESFLAALDDEQDRSFALSLFQMVESGDAEGTNMRIWFGREPMGEAFLHPRGLRYSPAKLAVRKDGRLMFSGTWTTYPDRVHHDGYVELAAFIGQDHREGTQRVVAAELDVGRVGRLVDATAVAINQQ